MPLIRGLLALGLCLGVVVLPSGLGAGEDPFTALALMRPSPPPPALLFTVQTPSGGTLSLTEYRGKVVLLNFWATWCPPCREEMPGMQRVYARFREKGLAVLAISLDADASPVGSFATEHRLTFPIGLDPEMRVAGRFRVTALPSTFLIDPEGRIVARAVGPREWDGPAGIAVLEQLLAER